MNDHPLPDVRKNIRQAWFKSLLIPLLLLAFFVAAPHWLNHKLHTQIADAIEASPNLSSLQRTERLERFALLDFQAICGEHPPAGMEKLHDQLVRAGIPGNFQRLHWALMLSLALVGGLLLATGVIHQLNAKARQSQNELIRGYQLGWRIGMAAALAKVFLLVPLLAYGTFEFSVLLSDHYFPKLLLMIVLGGLFALWRSGAILLKQIPLEFTERMCREVAPAEAPELWQAVHKAAERLHTPPPDRILIGLQLNFYVTELAVKHGSGRAEGKTLYLSLPLMKRLAADEVTAIIGHELGHFIGEDTKITREFYPLRFKVRATMLAMAGSGWVGWPSFQFLNYFAWCFGETEQATSRKRELLADQKAAELTTPQTAAHALIRFQVAAEAFQRGLKDSLQDKSLNLLDLPLQAIIQEKLAPEPAFWTQLFEKKLPHPLDSHPSLQVRLEALGQTVDVQSAQAIALASLPSAYEQWLANHPALFGGLTQQAEEVMETMRVAQADYSTEAGRELLEKHFPEKKWKAKPGWGVVVFLGILALLFLTVAIVVNESGTRIVFGSLLVLMVAGAFWARKQQRGTELTLNAEGLSHSKWQRPLSFKDVANITGRRQYSTIILTFHLKTKQPPFYKSAIIRSPGKQLLLSLSGGFEAKPAAIADSIFKYFKRHAGT
jgi:Zn-dependent protease with chaperone function